MSKPTLHQITVGATLGDAITDQALLIRRWLRELGFVSEIFAEHIHPALSAEIRSVTTYGPRAAEHQVIYHHSIGSDIAERLLTLRLQLIMIYHNVTPPEFFATADPAIAHQLAEGQRQLHALRAQTVLALADSPFNERDLIKAGYEPTGVLPITIDESRYNLPSNTELATRLAGSGPLFLFVGRLSPNKKQEDLIKLLYYYRRIEPSARLALVGDPWLPSYVHWLHEFACDLNLKEAVIFSGHVSQQDMLTYYREADVYVSLSEHEGFGKPLIESMYLGLPVLAYATTAVPSTMGEAGILLRHKHYEAIAELMVLLHENVDWRARVIARQRARAQYFLESQVRQRWQTFVASCITS